MGKLNKQADLQSALDAYNKHGSYYAAAVSLGIPRGTLHDRVIAAKNRMGSAKTVPMSENERKFHENWTAEDCITYLRKIAAADPDRTITRNHFRNSSDISEATWNRHFGSFEEYRRQAGLVLSRHQHRMERDVAKHAAVDRMRAMNVEKYGWEDAYSKPQGKRFQTILVGSDIHDIECDPFWRLTFIDTARRVQPAKTVLNGDVFDLPEFSRFSQDPREWDVVGRIAWVHAFLGDLREVCPDTEIILIEGNHEYRLLRHMAEATPAMRAVLSDLHGMTVPKLLGLDKFEVNYVAPADLATFTRADATAEIKRNWLLIYDHLIAHHFPEGRQRGLPGWNGHHHKHIVWPGFNPHQGAYEWHQLGCGHMRLASYTDGEKWSNGFLLVHVDTQRQVSQFEYVDVTHDHAVIGGRWYERPV